MLIKLFNQTIISPEEYHLLFVIEKDNSGVLNFTQSYLHKTTVKEPKSTKSGKTARFDSVSEKSV